MSTPTTLQNIGTDEIKAMKINELRTLCKTEKLPASGEKKELIKRLLVKKMGGDDRFVQDLIKCRICNAKVTVNDKRRQVECSGKRRHRYSINIAF